MEKKSKSSEKTKWLRLWTSTLFSRKLQELSGEEFKFWINFLCAARLNDGHVLVKDLLYHARLNEQKGKKLIGSLLKNNLATIEDGYLFPHDWEEWQFESDSSTERVRKHRENLRKQKDDRFGNVSCNGMEQKGNVSETTPETETETEKENTPLPPKTGGGECERKKSAEYPEAFETFWAAYPKKTGKGAALKAWKNSKPPLDACLSALAWQKRSEQWLKDSGQFIPNPATWLNQRRCEDEQPQSHQPVTSGKILKFPEPPDKEHDWFQKEVGNEIRWFYLNEDGVKCMDQRHFVY